MKHLSRKHLYPAAFNAIATPESRTNDHNKNLFGAIFSTTNDEVMRMIFKTPNICRCATLIQFWTLFLRMMNILLIFAFFEAVFLALGSP